MDWVGLVSSLIAIFSALGMYLFFVNSRWGKKYEHYQYGVMVIILIIACILGGVLKYILGFIS